MADDLAISVQIDADLDALDEKLKAATQMVGAFATSLGKAQSGSAAAAAKGHQAASSATSKVWDAAAKSIQSSMNSSIVGVLQGTTTLQAGLQKVATQITQQFLQAGLKIAENWAASQLKGLLVTRASEAQKGEAAATGAAGREAVNQGENTGLLGLIANAVASWLGLETGKTAATDANVAARTAANGAANAATAVQDFGLIEMAAAVASANAFAAYAAFPPIALAAAGAAWMTTMGFATGLGGGFSAAGGWDQVPYDGAITELHKDEMVLPASIASPLRRSLASPASGAAGQGGTMHFHFAPAVSAVDATGVDRLLQQHQDVFIRNVRNWHRNGKLGPKGALA